MQIKRAYRYELDPNNHQKTRLNQHAGTARFVYDWGLEQRNKLYQKKGKERYTDSIKQQKTLNKLKKTQFPWMYQVSKCAPQEALRDLQQAFQNFFDGLKGKRPAMGFPKFRKKGVNDSFRLTGTIKVVGRSIQLPRLGRIRLEEKKEKYFRGRILSATSSRKADKWFVSITVKEEIKISANEGETVVVDLGIKNLAVTSTGDVYQNPKALTTRLRKLKRLSKHFSRKENGSKNRMKARLLLARFHLKVCNIRKDTLYKLTTTLAKNHRQVVIEDLNVNGMKKNKKLARAVSDVGFFEFRRQLQYKTKWYGSKLVVAPRFFPSSKCCSNCGKVKEELSLSERVFRCEKCGFMLDRDLNAALNLLAVSCTDTLNACWRREVHATKQVLSNESRTEYQKDKMSYKGKFLTTGFNCYSTLRTEIEKSVKKFKRIYS
ncbi:MAG: RNA-guided endonuclease InsQ/TnpB family protein [Candidatus Ranarchaeia archaeon]